MSRWFPIYDPEGRMEHEARDYVTRHMKRAAEIDPDAFRDGSQIQYWPSITDARQKAALAKAASG